MGSPKNIQGGFQFAIAPSVQILHHQQGNIFVRHVLNEEAFQGIREGGMAQIVQEDGHQAGATVIGAEAVTLVGQYIQGLLHQVHGTEGMGQPRMGGSWINQVGHAQLTDIAKPLEEGMIYQAQYQLGLQSYKAVQGIVKDFVGQGQGGLGKRR